jgi:hypothetical protein
VEELEDEAERLTAEAEERFLRERLHARAVDLDRSRGGAVERADQVEEGRLPGTAASQERDHLAAIDREGDAGERMHVLAGGVDLRDLGRRAMDDDAGCSAPLPRADRIRPCAPCEKAVLGPPPPSGGPT